MRRLVLLLGLAAFCLSPLFVQAQPAPPSTATLTLDQALALAAARSFTLSAAQHELDAAEGALQQAGVWRNPALNTTLEDTRSATRTTTTTLDTTIELGGKRAARVGAAQRARALADAELGHARAQLRAQVVQAFFAVLVAQERSQLSTDSEALATRGADAVARRVAAGKLSPVEQTRSLVDRANAQLETAEAAAELQATRHALAALWGDLAPQFGSVQAGVQNSVPTDLPANMQTGMQTGMQAGTQTNTPGIADALPDRAPPLPDEIDAAPTLRSSRAEAERRRALVTVERSKQHPDLTLSVGAKRDNEMGRTQAIVGLSLALPLFDRNQGAITEALRRADKADDEHQAARLHLLAELQRAAGQLALARSTALTLKTTVLPAARSAHDAAAQGFDAGKFSFTDVLDAQRALLQARVRQLSAMSAAHQAAAAIDRLLGR